MTKRNKTKGNRGLWLAALLCVVVIVLSLSSVGRIDRGVTSKQSAQLKESLLHAAVTCYAVEGRYPPTLDYLCENYGVHIDASRYFVTYDVMGSNIMPTVAVLKRGVW